MSKSTDANEYVHQLLVTYALRESVIRSAIQALNLRQGSHGLDAGCGSGLPTILLANSIGKSGYITGLDISRDALDYAEEYTAQAGYSDQVSFKVGDIRNIPFEEDRFDWAWSMDLVGYAPFEPLPLIRELARVVKPGGTIAIAAWSSEKLLPGYPKLEALLSATSAGIAPFVEGKEPEYTGYCLVR